MHKYSKEGIMVNLNQTKMIEIHLQEDPPHSSHKEASIRMKGLTKEKIMIIQAKNLEGIHHKEDHSLPSMQIYIMVIVFLVLTLDIRL